MSEVIDFEKCKVADLKRMLKERGLSNTGNKSDLVLRLQAYEAASENGAEDVVADEDELLQDGEDEEVEEEEDDDGAGGKAEVEAEEEPEVDAEIDAEVDEGDEVTAAKETPEPKTIKLNKPVEITSTTAAKPGAAEAPEETKTTPEEGTGMLAKRAERFGIQSADAKKLARAQRFGIPVTSPTGSTGSANGKIKVGSSTPQSAEELEKLKKRAERFGTVVSEPLAKMAEKEKILKRKERFGALTTTSTTSSAASNQEMDEKKRRRLERFGNPGK